MGTLSGRRVIGKDCFHVASKLSAIKTSIRLGETMEGLLSLEAFPKRNSSLGGTISVAVKYQA